MNENPPRFWLASAAARICVFLFLFSLLVLSLFLLGNFQNFLDSTQIMLLRLFEVTSLLYLVAALYFLALRIALAIVRRQQWKVLPSLLSLAGAAFLLGTYLIVGFLFAWLKPLN